MLFLYSFEYDGRDGEMRADRVVIASQRGKVRKIRRDWLEARRADLAAHPEVSGADIRDSGPQPGMPPEEG